LAICCFREVTPYIAEVSKEGGAEDHMMMLVPTDSKAQPGAVII